MSHVLPEPKQCDTPTTRLLAQRKTRRVESTGLFRFNVKVHCPIKAKVAADYLRSAAREIEASQAEHVKFEFKAEEVKT